MAMFENLLHDPTTESATTPYHGVWDRLRSSNWGLAVACGLIAAGMGVAMLHSHMVASASLESPDPEIAAIEMAEPQDAQAAEIVEAAEACVAAEQVQVFVID